MGDLSFFFFKNLHEIDWLDVCDHTLVSHVSRYPTPSHPTHPLTQT